MSQKVHRSSDSNEIKPGRIYRGTWDCFKITLKHEGVTALYKGFLPAWYVGTVSITVKLKSS